MEIHWDINLELIPQAQAEQDMAQAPGHRAMGPWGQPFQNGRHDATWPLTLWPLTALTVYEWGL